MAVSCPGCGASFALGDEAAGQRFRCDSCGTTFQVPPAIVRPAISVGSPLAPAKRPAKAIQWGTVAVSLVIGSLLTSCLWCCAGLFRTTPEPEFIQGGAYNASRIYYHWRDDAEAAADLYLDRRFNIYGSVKNREDGGSVIIVSDITRTSYAARCIMRPTEKNVGHVQFHSLVQIRGTCRGPRSKRDEIVFEDCELQVYGTGQESFKY